MFRFERVTVALVASTDAAWTAQLEAASGEVPESKYRQAIHWARCVASGDCDGHAYVYALIRDGEEAACALAEITHAMAGHPGAWLKVLRIVVEPRLDVGGDDSAIQSGQLAKIASSLLTESLELTFDQHPSGELKVYGSTPLTRDFLEAVCGFMSESALVRVTTHGNWLVLSK